MNPADLSAALRSFADRIDRSDRPSRSAVSAELRRVLAGLGDGPQQQQASPVTKVVINENWQESDLPDVVSEHGGVSVRQGNFGEYGIEMPADQAAQFGADPGEGAYVFDSWEDAIEATGEPDGEYDFEPVPGFPGSSSSASPPPAPSSAVSEWKTSILQALEDGDEVSHDSIHEGAEDDADLEAAEKALDELKAAGQIRENNGVFHAG